MILQLWSGSRTREYRAARDRRRRKRAYRPGMESLDERCLLSANVVTHFDQAVRAPVGVGAAPAQVAFIIPSPNPAPSSGVAKAASPPPSHNPGASSSATIGGTASTSSSLASSFPTGPTFSEITEVSPSLFAAPLTTTAPPAASAPPTAQSAVNPFGPSSAPAPAPFAGQALLVSQKQVLWSAHLGQEDELGDSEATGSEVDEEEQAERFIKIIEKPKATAPTKAPEQTPAPAPKLGPILPDENLESVLDVLDYGLLTALFEAGPSRPDSAPKEPDSSPGLFAMLRAAALSTGALLLAIPVAKLSLWRRLERRQRSKLPDF
jgi:hypothetical protein